MSNGFQIISTCLEFLPQDPSPTFFAGNFYLQSLKNNKPLYILDNPFRGQILKTNTVKGPAVTPTPR